VIETLLDRLKGVRGSKGSYTARCPAHADRSPSLAIREADGTILLHCFAGCDVHQIVEAVGLDLQDLFPPMDGVETFKPSMKRPFYSSDLLKIIAFEALVVQIVALDIAEGKNPSESDRERMRLAYERIDEATRYV
jgi:hypothetical protein